jgi:hypothetical protein
VYRVLFGIPDLPVQPFDHIASLNRGRIDRNLAEYKIAPERRRASAARPFPTPPSRDNHPAFRALIEMPEEPYGTFLKYGTLLLRGETRDAFDFDGDSIVPVM